MPDLTRMTPGRAELLGDRWRAASLTFLAPSIVFALFELGNFFWLCVVLCFVCSREATEHRAWRRGYLARQRQEQQDAEPAGDRRG